MGGVLRVLSRGSGLSYAKTSCGVTAGQHDVGTLGACSARRFKADARASADHDDGLPERRGLAHGGIRC
jgi:hypothetical protein